MGNSNGDASKRQEAQYVRPPQRNHEQLHLRRAAREEMIEELLRLGEERASLRLVVGQMGGIPRPALETRDLADNLRTELARALERLEKKTSGDEMETGSAVPKDDTGRVEMESKIEEARTAVKNLEETIKHFDRVDRELSMKLETLEAKRLVRRMGAFFGGFLILIGGVLMTGGVLLVIGGPQLEFVYSAFDEFFNYLIIFVGVALIASGFLHQV